MQQSRGLVADASAFGDSGKQRPAYRGSCCVLSGSQVKGSWEVSAVGQQAVD